MALSTAIYNIIRANSNCLTTFGDRILPVDVPLDVVVPCVVYRLDSTEPDFSQTDTDDWETFNITLTVYAATYSLCETYSGYVKTAVSRYRGSTGSTTVKETNYLGMSDNEIRNIGQEEDATTGIGVFSRDLQFHIIVNV